jgi:periplasmic divalent cation tolerance protein
VPNSEYCIVYVTASSEPEAFRIAENAVQDKFAACANISPKMSSVYWWEGVVQNSEEFIVILKTTKDKFAQLEHMIKKMHSYENPCIIMLDIESGSKEFLNWISDTVNRK